VVLNAEVRLENSEVRAGRGDDGGDGGFFQIGGAPGIGGLGGQGSGGSPFGKGGNGGHGGGGLGGPSFGIAFVEGTAPPSQEGTVDVINADVGLSPNVEPPTVKVAEITVDLAATGLGDVSDVVAGMVFKRGDVELVSQYFTNYYDRIF
jgi:hypothetical protein